MTIRFTCQCGKKLRTTEELSGKKVKCPSCGRLMVVPVSQASTETPLSEKPIAMDSAAEHIAKLQGTWVMVAAGNKAGEFIAGLLRYTLTFKEDKCMSVAFLGLLKAKGDPLEEQVRTGKFKINASTEPKKIDLVFDTGTQRGIFKWQDESLLMALAGPDKDRPKSFQDHNVFKMATADCASEHANKMATAVGERAVSKGAGGCFIATAACGSEHANQVMRLREFRELVLRQTRTGRTLIAVYETVSPPIARFIASSALFRRFVRSFVVYPASVVADWWLAAGGCRAGGTRVRNR